MLRTMLTKILSKIVNLCCDFHFGSFVSTQLGTILELHIQTAIWLPYYKNEHIDYNF